MPAQAWGVGGVGGGRGNQALELVIQVYTLRSYPSPPGLGGGGVRGRVYIAKISLKQYNIRLKN